MIQKLRSFAHNEVAVASSESWNIKMLGPISSNFPFALSLNIITITTNTHSSKTFEGKPWHCSGCLFEGEQSNVFLPVEFIKEP